MTVPGTHLLRTALVAVGLAAAGLTSAAESPSVSQSPAGAAVDAYLERLSEYGFSGGVVLEKDGHVVLARGYGLANRESGARMTERTPVYVASVSKMFIAAAALKLVEAGRLSLDDRLGALLDEVPPDKRDIPLRLLLTHHSGLSGEDTDIAGISQGAFLRAVLCRPLESTPGTTYRYSNDGYGLVAAIVERVSRQPFAAFIRTELFEPAGMKDTALITTAPESWRSRTQAYRGEHPMGDLLATERRPYGWNEVSGTGVLTSAWDLYLWHRALAQGTVLSKRMMEARMPPRPGGEGLGLNGWTSARGTFQYGHGGLYLPAGWNASFRELPDDSGFIAVVSNAFSGRSLGEYAADAADALLFGGSLMVPPATTPCDNSTLQHSTGLFRTAHGAAFRTVAEAGSLIMEPENQAAVNLLLFESEADRPDLTRANDLAQSTVLGLPGGSPGLPESQRDRLDALRHHVVQRLGPIQSHSSVSVPSTNDAGTVESFVRLKLRYGSAVIRVISREGTPTRVSGLDSYGSASFELEHRAGRIRLTCPSPARFAAFDFSTEKILLITAKRRPDGILAAMGFRDGAGLAVARRLAEGDATD